MALTASPVEANSCKILKGEFVGFGEQATRHYADQALDKQISAWEAKYGRTAAPQARQMVCKDYIKALNEYECTVQAEVCR